VPNSGRTLRSNYREASVQTDEEKDCWYNMPPPSTPKKTLISLSKRLLIRQHKIRVQAEARVAQHGAYGTNDVEVQTASNASIPELRNSHSHTISSSSALLVDVTEVPFGGLQLPVEDRATDLHGQVPPNSLVSKGSQALPATGIDSCTPSDITAPYHTTRFMTRSPSDPTFSLPGRSPAVRSSFGKNPDFATGNQRGNFESPKEGDSSSAQNQSGTDSSRGSFIDSSQSSGKRNKPGQQKPNFWSKLIGVKEPSLDALNELREKTFKEAKVGFDDPNAAVKLNISSQKLPPEALRPDSKETEPFHKTWPPNKPRPSRPTFQNPSGIRVTPTKGHRMDGTDGHTTRLGQKKFPAGSKDLEESDGENVAKRTKFLGRFRNRK
jgi:hypothetical protein